MDDHCDDDWDDDKLNRSLASFHQKMAKQRKNWLGARRDSTVLASDTNNNNIFAANIDNSEMLEKTKFGLRANGLDDQQAKKPAIDGEEPCELATLTTSIPKWTEGHTQPRTNRRNLYREMIAIDSGHNDKSGRIKQAKDVFEKQVIVPLANNQSIRFVGRKRSHSHSGTASRAFKIACVEEKSLPFAELKAKWEEMAREMDDKTNYHHHQTSSYLEDLSSSRTKLNSPTDDLYGDSEFANESHGSNRCVYGIGSSVDESESVEHTRASQLSQDNNEGTEIDVNQMICEITKAFADIDNSVVSECVQTSPQYLYGRKTRSCSPDDPPIVIKYPDTAVSAVFHEEKKKRSQSTDTKSAFMNQLKDRVQALKQQAQLSEVYIQQTALAMKKFLDGIEGRKFDFNRWVECSRTMLSETHKRQAILEEANRITAKIDNPRSTLSFTQANICFSSLTLPIDPTYMKNLMDGTEKRVFYFVAFVHCMGHAYQTCLSSTAEIALSSGESVPKKPSIILSSHMNFENVDPDFEARIYVYCLERLHSGSDLRSLFKPSAGKSVASSLDAIRRALENKVCSAAKSVQKARNMSFVQIDCVRIDKNNFYDRSFDLKVGSSSTPIVGKIYCTPIFKVNDNIECEGFLTLYDIVAGFGAWRRMWTLLRNNKLMMWNYSDTFNNSNGAKRELNCERCAHVIDLELWASQKVANIPVTLLPFAECARQNSIELSRSACDNIKDKRLSFWMSADSLSEAKTWCSKLNSLLTLISDWSPLYSRQKKEAENRRTVSLVK